MKLFRKGVFLSASDVVGGKDEVAVCKKERRRRSRQVKNILQ